MSQLFLLHVSVALIAVVSPSRPQNPLSIRTLSLLTSQLGLKVTAGN